MRISEQNQKEIKEIILGLLGPETQVYLFGSRVDDQQFGGDIDIMIKTDRPIEHPAEFSSKTSARISRLCGGRDVDILLSSPNLRAFPIHAIAEQEGIRL